MCTVGPIYYVPPVITSCGIPSRITCNKNIAKNVFVSIYFHGIICTLEKKYKEGEKHEEDYNNKTERKKKKKRSKHALRA